MSADGKLMDMLTGYAAAHQHPFNIFVHMIGIPTIMFGYYLAQMRRIAVDLVAGHPFHRDAHRPGMFQHLDCLGRLRFEDSSKDVVVVHGGLHHLAVLPDDLEIVFREVCRVLRPDGRFVFVEPWLTPFLKLVHAACRISLLRYLYPRLDALSEMIAGEKRQYTQWLNQSDLVYDVIQRYFSPERVVISLGKMSCVARQKVAV